MKKTRDYTMKKKIQNRKKFIKIGRDFLKGFEYEIKVDVQPIETCVCGALKSPNNP